MPEQAALKLNWQAGIELVCHEPAVSADSLEWMPEKALRSLPIAMAIATAAATPLTSLCLMDLLATEWSSRPVSILVRMRATGRWPWPELMKTWEPEQPVLELALEPEPEPGQMLVQTLVL